MRARRRAVVGEEEAESYYASMTDMLVGVLFIFIILLSFFALQFRRTTQALTQAKDAQTATLLKLATNLERRTVDLEIDRQHRVVCIPGAALGAGGTGEADRHCFAFSDQALTAAERTTAAAVQARKQFTTALQGDVAREAPPVPVQAGGDGSLTFDADKLFLPGSATLSSAGAETAQRVAQALSERLPCYGYGVPTPQGCPNGATKLSLVNVAGQAGFDAYTAQGRAAVALSLERAVAFHDALLRAQPLLGQIRNAPSGGAPLLQVSNYGQGQSSAPPPGAGQTISIQFNMP